MTNDEKMVRIAAGYLNDDERRRVAEGFALLADAARRSQTGFDRKSETWAQLGRFAGAVSRLALRALAR
jgi:hypothetical protein